MKAILELNIKRSIYHYILKHPGLHFRELVRELSIPRTTLNYHLRSLQKRGLLEEKQNHGYTRYYITNNLGRFEKKLLHIIRRETPRNILLYIFLYVGASQIQLSRDLEKHPTTIEFHLKKFLDMGIIEPAPVNKKGFNIASNNFFVERPRISTETIYRFKDSKLIYNLLVIFHKKKILDDDFSDFIFNYFDTITPGRTIPKIVRSEKGILERFERLMYDIFPPFFVT